MSTRRKHCKFSSDEQKELDELRNQQKPEDYDLIDKLQEFYNRKIRKYYEDIMRDQMLRMESSVRKNIKKYTDLVEVEFKNGLVQ